MSMSVSITSQWWKPFSMVRSCFSFQAQRARERWISWLKLSTTSVSSSTSTTSCVIECGETVCVGTQAHIHVGRTKATQTTMAVNVSYPAVASLKKTSMGPPQGDLSPEMDFTYLILYPCCPLHYWITQCLKIAKVAFNMASKASYIFQIRLVFSGCNNHNAYNLLLFYREIEIWVELMNGYEKSKVEK